MSDDHRTPEWLAEFQRGKDDALSQSPGRSPDIDTRRKQRQEIVDMMRTIRANQGEFPTDPYNHGRLVMLGNLLEENEM